MKTQIRLTINKEIHELEINPCTTLLELLREELHLMGTKEGCGLGDCGTCVVLLEGRPVNSCLVLAVDTHGREITTIEGLASDENLHPLQEAFIEKGAVQCGFCSPGMILSAKALLDGKPDPDEEEIKQALSGVLCRCGSYTKILEAVQSASQRMKR